MDILVPIMENIVKFIQNIQSVISWLTTKIEFFGLADFSPIEILLGTGFIIFVVAVIIKSVVPLA